MADNRMGLADPLRKAFDSGHVSFLREGPATWRPSATGAAPATTSGPCG